METLDNFWMEEVHSDMSNSAFKFYYLKPMTYREGMQVVERYRLLFQCLQNSSFTLHINWLTITMKQLISRNLLFYDAVTGSLTVQTRLLKRAIAQKLQYLY